MNQEVLFSEEWQDYRRLEIEAGMSFVHEIWNRNADPVYIRGAVDMLRKIIQIPEKAAKTDEAKMAAAALIQSAMHKVEMDLMRKFLTAQAP